MTLLKEVQEDFYVRKVTEKCTWTKEELKKYSQDYYQKRLDYAKHKMKEQVGLSEEEKAAKKLANTYKSRKDRVS